MANLDGAIDGEPAFVALGEETPSQPVVEDQPKSAHRDSTPELLLKFLLPFIWFYIVIGIPFVILGVKHGWGYLFKSGDAAAFMCGAIVAALAENIIEQIPDKFAALKHEFTRISKSIDETGMTDVQWYMAALVFLGWNLYYAFSDGTAGHTGWDWVQLVVFFMPVGLLPLVRFVFTAYDFAWLRWLLRLYTSLLN
jgi:hypothetical protein